MVQRPSGPKQNSCGSADSSSTVQKSIRLRPPTENSAMTFESAILALEFSPQVTAANPSVLIPL